MSRKRFTLSSDQLELLLAFEECEGLGHLAEMMAKDPSVVSRGLQKIAEELPVLLKVKGRWELTPLGRETNALTRDFIQKQKELLLAAQLKPATKSDLVRESVLVIINAQCGLLDATQLGRNNSEAETNIAALLKLWRRRNRPVIHVKHVSEQPGSVFYRHAKGSEFLPGLTPVKGEEIIEKTKSSAFRDTLLESRLREQEFANLVLVGFTANECIDATARDASALGFSTCVVGDATAMFDLKTPDGKLLKADRVHKLTLANLNAFYAKVMTTAEII